MKILSLFDGISCARLALERAGIKVDEYYASEIDKYAIQIAQHNFPDTIQLGDVTRLVGEGGFKNYIPSIDLLIGGSPCQDLSIAKKDRKGLDGERSGLFWNYVYALQYLKPKYFILENVASMPKEAKKLISETLGVNPIMINASLVSAQNRKRLFWTNIKGVELPPQKEYNVYDYIDGEGFPTSCGNDRIFKKKEIFNTLTATYYKGIRGAGRPAVSIREGFLDTDRKAHRMLTPIECERLQGVPDNYTLVPHPVYKNRMMSDTQRYKCLGNAFNVDVVSWIISFIGKKEYQKELKFDF